MIFIGIDFGATSIKTALVTRTGVVKARATRRTVGAKGPDALIDDLAEMVGKLSAGRRVGCRALNP